jgi:methionyl-tRNA synthetase
VFYNNILLLEHLAPMLLQHMHMEGVGGIGEVVVMVNKDLVNKQGTVNNKVMEGTKEDMEGTREDMEGTKEDIEGTKEDMEGTKEDMEETKADMEAAEDMEGVARDTGEVT